MTDVRLDDVDGTHLVFDARVVMATASDLMLDSPDRRRGGGPYRRALVHDEGDRLTINYAGDYPGGVKVQSSDLMLDSAARRKKSGGFRRALVHDQNDGLTLNFNGDYPGGITLTNVSEIVPQGKSSSGIRSEITVVAGTPNLIVRGGISYEVADSLLRVGGATRTVIVEEEFKKLRKQIADLSERVAALEKH
ncbi:MAG: hypothetical protein E6P95_01495 [Candidatus Moraniibacteriota bacterium]|nr:MAG: hypothetical protein E6P95_01495 [Candidatus Moranbacteria bacterium]